MGRTVFLLRTGTQMLMVGFCSGLIDQEIFQLVGGLKNCFIDVPDDLKGFYFRATTILTLYFENVGFVRLFQCPF